MDASGWHKTVFKNSFVPTGPVTRTSTGPAFGWTVRANVRKGQHSRSAAITSAATAMLFRSPDRRKANPSGSSSIAVTADRNCPRSVASRCRSSADDKEQATGRFCGSSFMGGWPGGRRRSCGGIRRFVRSDRRHESMPPRRAPGELRRQPAKGKSENT